MYPQQNQYPPQGYAPQGGAFGAPTAQGSNGGYEFNELENSVMRELAESASFYGTLAVVIGVLGTLGSVITLANGTGKGISTVVTVLGLAAQGMFARSAAERFQAVVNTQGNDIPFVLDALAKLQRFYIVMAVVTSVSALSTLVSAASLFMGPSV